MVEIVLQQDKTMIEPIHPGLELAGIAAGVGIEPLETPIRCLAFGFDLQGFGEGEKFGIAPDVLQIVRPGAINRIAQDRDDAGGGATQGSGLRGGDVRIGDIVRGDITGVCFMASRGEQGLIISRRGRGVEMIEGGPVDLALPDVGEETALLARGREEDIRVLAQIMIERGRAGLRRTDYEKVRPAGFG